jgi:hypothetical protein
MEKPQEEPQNPTKIVEVFAKISAFKETIYTSRNLAEEIEEFLDGLEEEISSLGDFLEEKVDKRDLGTLEQFVGLPTPCEETTADRLTTIVAELPSKLSFEMEDVASTIRDSVLDQPDAKLRQKLQALAQTLEHPRETANAFSLTLAVRRA